MRSDNVAIGPAPPCPVLSLGPGNKWGYFMKAMLFAAGCIFSTVAFARGDSWSEIALPLAAGATRIASVSVPEGGALEVFTDETSFEAAVGDPNTLVTEAFENGSTTPLTVHVCNEPVDASSDDACFSPGDLAEGFALTSSGGNGIAALGAGVLGVGQTTTAIGANDFTQSTVLGFPLPIGALAADFFSGAGGGEITVEAFDADDVSLGTAMVNPASPDAPTFLGIVSAEPIARVTVTGANNGGEAIDNLRFAVAPAGDIIFQDGFDPAPMAPPTVAKAFAPTSIVADATSVLTITLGNANAVSATLTAELVDTLPSGLVIADPPDAATTCASAAVAADPGSDSVTLFAGAGIPAAASCSVTLSVTSAAAGTYSNIIPAGSLQTDLGNSTADASADLTVTDSGSCSPIQLLQDPGFELTDNTAFPYTNPAWAGTSTNFVTPFCDEFGCGNGGGSASPHGGTFWVWLGGAGALPETSTVSQSVVIPAGDTRFLNFWLWIGATGDGSTNLDVLVDATVVTSFPEPNFPDAAYTQRGVDISAFADGALHTIDFVYTSPGSASSNYSIDDVTVDCVPAPVVQPLPMRYARSGSTHRVVH
jgi:hypothetical protein